MLGAPSFPQFHRGKGGRPRTLRSRLAGPHDAEGNITAADSGSTAKYTYDAMNRKVRIDVPGDANEFVFNPAGRRASYWDPVYGWEVQGQTYWGSAPVEFYENSVAHFQHQNWLGTERMRTTYNASVEGTFQSLPFGDGQSTIGTDNDAYHFAGLDHDYATDTDHAMLRQYSNAQGHWLKPDPYAGSYDFSNPQSMNRYAYALNNPISNFDPSGLDLWSGDGYGGNDPNCSSGDVNCCGGGGGGGNYGVDGASSGDSNLGLFGQGQYCDLPGNCGYGVSGALGETRYASIINTGWDPLLNQQYYTYFFTGGTKNVVEQAGGPDLTN
jgi:RHS repeat-associated protein